MSLQAKTSNFFDTLTSIAHVQITIKLDFNIRNSCFKKIHISVIVQIVIVSFTLCFRIVCWMI